MNTVFLTKERGKVRESEITASESSQARVSNHVRRPTRGIVIKEDTFATLRLVALDNGETKTLVDAGSNRPLNDGRPLDVNGQRWTDIYSNFLVQSVQRERVEKAQILETFGEAFLFLFGERAQILNIQGILLNTYDFNWRQEWQFNYENFIRGTKCVENDARVYLSVGDNLVSGYILNTTEVENAQDRNFVQFNFSLFVTGYTSLTKVGSPDVLPGGPKTLTGQQARIDEIVGRPHQIVRTDIRALEAIGAGRAQDPSLIDSLFNEVLGDVGGALKTVSRFLNSVSRFVTNALTGTVVRVPNGYVGSLVFDDSSLFDPLKITNDFAWWRTTPGVVQYTTFADNFDEYVGSSDHYGTAIRPSGARQDILFEAPKFTGQDYVNKAVQIWLDNGIDPPDREMSFVERLLLGAAVGVVIAAGASWARNGNTKKVTGDAINNSVTGAYVLRGIISADQVKTATPNQVPTPIVVATPRSRR